MARRPVRFNLGGLMGVVGVVGVVLALSRWQGGPFVVAPMLVLGLVGALVRWAGMTARRAIVWVIMVYPWLFIAQLYLAWGSYWLVLTRYSNGQWPPEAVLWIRFCKGLAGVLMVSLPLVFVLGLVLIPIDLILTINETDPNQQAQTVHLMVAPVVSWHGALVWLWADPGSPWGWFID